MNKPGVDSGVSVAVFSGNTPDISTFSSQILKIADQFGCKQVTVVGDRGMIKSAQIDQLPQGIHYITAITKPQINKLIDGRTITNNSNTHLKSHTFQRKKEEEEEVIYYPFPIYPVAYLMVTQLKRQ